MKYQYTAYLSYPDDLDGRIRTIHDLITQKWPNKRTFEFKPMIPIWKVLLERMNEGKLIGNISIVAPDLGIPLKTNGLTAKERSSYIFVTFDKESSQILITYSEKIRSVMRVAKYEDYMPYGFEPHTSLVKQEPSVLGEIMQSIKDKLNDTIFTPKELVVSRETKTDDGPVFDIIYKYQF